MNVDIYSRVTERSQPAPIVAETDTTVTAEFARWQFPSERYTVTFDKASGRAISPALPDIMLTQLLDTRPVIG